MTTLASLLQRACDSALLHDFDLPISAHVAGPPSRLVVITGSNASGKSLLVQILSAVAHAKGALPITISIRERTGAGMSDIAGMRRMMMFGDESEQSTGATSTKTAQAGFSNLASHAKDKPSLLVLDEPDMGLSEDYAAAMGAWIAREVAALDANDPNLLGVVVVSHSRPLVRALASGMSQQSQPLQFVSMGAPLSLSEWLDATPARSIQELMDLPKLGLERRLSVHKAMDALRDRKEKTKPAPPRLP